FIVLSLLLSAQTSKTVSVTTAGTLNLLISGTEANSITNLTVRGNIDARDVAFMRENIKYLSVLDLSAVKIKSYTGSDGTYGGTSIFYPANEMPLCSFYNSTTFTYKTSLTSVALPNTATSIGGSAFCYCSGLTGTFSIPASVTSIGDYALYGCTQLSAFAVETANTRYSSYDGVLYNKNQDSLFVCPLSKSGSLTLPQTVVHIGPSALESCSSLTGTLTLPSSLKSIGDYAFYYCTGFTGNLAIPGSIVSIGNDAFQGCSGLTGTINIPQTLSYFGAYAFFDCTNLASFQVSPSNPYYSSVNDVLYNKNQDTLYICPGAKSAEFTIPATVKAVGSYAFYKCSQLSGSLTIPSGVNSIGDFAFYGCSTLSAFIVESQNPKYSSNNGVLFNKNQDTLLVYPGGKSGSYAVPNTVNHISTYAFSNCIGITGLISIPPSVVSIGEYAFYGCTGFTGFAVDANNNYYSSVDGLLLSHNQDSIYICPLSKSGIYIIPGTVTNIAYCAFDGCTALTEIVVPNSVQTIEQYAFEFCTGLKKLTLSKNLTTIGTGAFYFCTALQNIAAANPTPTAIDYYTFYMVNKSTCQLTVPYGSLLKYQSSAYWNEFVKIAEGSFIDTSTQSPNPNAIKIYSKGMNLIIEGLSAGERVEVYAISGIKIKSVVSTGSIITIALQKASIYLVKTTREVRKFVL
ncbi:MAG: leucine-rich repeat domain-containing protein, partial [Paludibacter sp.]